jgi:hypothetical protein
MLQLAVMVPHFGNEIRLTSPPWAVQRATFGMLAPIAKLFGYHPEYPYPYDSRSDKPPSPEGARSPARSGARRDAVMVTVLIVFFLASLLLWQRRRRSGR